MAVRDGSCKTIARAIVNGRAQWIVVELIAIATIAHGFRLRDVAAALEIGVELPDAPKRLGIEFTGTFGWSRESGIGRRDRRGT
jgi:hypothetical protein